MKLAILLGAGTLLTAIALPASASTVVTTDCISVTDPAGCLFDGNINGNTDPGNANSFLNAQNAYNAVRNPDIALTFITKSDDGNFGSFGSFTGAGAVSGTWTLSGWSVRYLAVKASNQFRLYDVGGVSSGSWSTAGIGNGQHEISHLAFFGAAVPEPSAWALLILGFGATGTAMRQRKAKLRFA